MAPAYLAELCLPITAPASRRGGLRSATTSNLVIPRCRLSTYGTRAFSVAGPVCWNSLLDYLKSSDLSFNCFRQQLKTFLFCKYWHQYHHYSLLQCIRDIVDALYKCTILTYLLIRCYCNVKINRNGGTHQAVVINGSTQPIIEPITLVLVSLVHLIGQVGRLRNSPGEVCQRLRQITAVQSLVATN